MKISQGAKFRQALKDNNPLQIVGAINAYCAMLAQDAGHKAIYLSGVDVDKKGDLACVANALNIGNHIV